MGKKNTYATEQLLSAQYSKHKLLNLKRALCVTQNWSDPSFQTWGKLKWQRTTNSSCYIRDIRPILLHTGLWDLMSFQQRTSCLPLILLFLFNTVLLIFSVNSWGQTLLIPVYFFNNAVCLNCTHIELWEFYFNINTVILIQIYINASTSDWPATWDILLMFIH